MAEKEEVSNESNGTGLGLEGFISNSTPSEKSEEGVVSDDSTEKTEEEVETQVADSKEVSEEKETTESTTDETTSEETSEEVKTEESSTESESKEDDTPDPRLEELEKQLKDTRTWGNAANMELQDLKKTVAKMQAEADGTYVEDAGPSPEEIAQSAELEGRIKASKKLAEDKFGKEYVADNLTNADSDFQKMRETNPLIDMRLRISDTPFIEAVNILNEEKFFEKYSRNPESIKEKIRSELEVEVREQVNKEFKAKLKEKEKLPKDIGEARGAQVAPTKEPDNKPKSLDKLFAIN